MYVQKKTKFWVKALCWLLVGMMLLSVATYAIFAIIALF